MHDAETRALRRAAILLIMVSSLRWGWSRWNRPPPVAGETVLPELLAASRQAGEEQQERDQPLADGERIDPNRADEVQLDRLPGVGPTTARAITAARDSGIVFRRPEDLLAVRGVGPATLALIRDALDLRRPPAGERAHRTPVAGRLTRTPVGARATGGPAERRAPPALGAQGALVDVNRAGPEALEALPGVGPAIAARIVAAREERLFASLDDLLRVRGIGPATLARLRPHAMVGRNR